jgi:hypothetical protein
MLTERIPTEHIRTEQLAALHDAAHRRAHELRREAIAALFAQAADWVGRRARRLLSLRRSAPGPVGCEIHGHGRAG